MTRPARRRPIESFGSNLLDTLIKGSREEVKVIGPYRKAVKFRQRLYQLRAVMRDTKHPLYRNVASAYISITWESTVEEVVSSKNVKHPRDIEAEVTVTIQPQDSQFRDMLLKAGMKEADLQSDPLDPNATTEDGPPEGQQVSDLDAILYGLERKKPA